MMSSPLKVGEAMRKFEAELAKESRGESYYHLVITGEYNRLTCNGVEKMYEGAGWSKAICKTTSERNERPGLTGLQLHV